MSSYLERDKNKTLVSFLPDDTGDVSVCVYLRFLFLDKISSQLCRSRVLNRPPPPKPPPTPNVSSSSEIAPVLFIPEILVIGGRGGTMEMPSSKSTPRPKSRKLIRGQNKNYKFDPKVPFLHTHTLSTTCLSLTFSVSWSPREIEGMTLKGEACFVAMAAILVVCCLANEIMSRRIARQI